jgi:hypothetical protein
MAQSEAGWRNPNERSDVMIRKLMPLAMCCAFAAVPALTGCDKTVSKETTTERKSDGTSKVEEKKTVQSPDGKVTETTKEKSSNP